METFLFVSVIVGVFVSGIFFARLLVKKAAEIVRLQEEQDEIEIEMMRLQSEEDRQQNFMPTSFQVGLNKSLNSKFNSKLN